MSYQVIARKYRPQGFDSVLGQDAIARTLRNAISQNRVAHAYMFCGPRGVGKTSMARILARALNCLSSEGPSGDPCGTCDLCVRAATGDDLDVLEIDAASNRKVDDARTLIAGVSFHPTRARFKVYIVDEVHMLTTEAFNALLKTLEEPPAHVKFIFATTDPQKVPPTILSRCQRFDFRPVPDKDIVRSLTQICIDERLEAEEEALVAIARAAAGGMRDAQSLLDQLGTLGGGKVKLDDLHALLGTVSAAGMRRVFDALAAGDAKAAFAEAGGIFDAGTDPAEFLRQCLRHTHDLMLAKAGGPRSEGESEMRRAAAEQAKAFSEATLVHAVTVFGEALKSAKLLGESRLFAETALARLAGHRDMRFLDQVVRDLQSLERKIGSGGFTAGSASGDSAAPTAGSVPLRAATVKETAAAQAATTAPSSAANPAEGLSTDAVRARWNDVLEASRSDGFKVRTALQAATVENLDGDVLTLGLTPENSVHAKNLADAKETLAALFERALGRRLGVAFVERAPEPKTAEETQRRAPADSGERLTAAERAAAEQSPLTRLVEKELKARIVHMERQD